MGIRQTNWIRTFWATAKRRFYPSPFPLLPSLSLALNAHAQLHIDENGVRASGRVIGDEVLYVIGGGRAVSDWAAGQRFPDESPLPRPGNPPAIVTFNLSLRGDMATERLLAGRWSSSPTSGATIQPSLIFTIWLASPTSRFGRMSGSGIVLLMSRCRRDYRLLGQWVQMLSARSPDIGFDHSPSVKKSRVYLLMI
ncbi:MAG: hypothetical protein LBI87_00085 [Candidatus Accumulibacter sp.]|nr:hypothetical protein [Accumulibacter sp.]